MEKLPVDKINEIPETMTMIFGGQLLAEKIMPLLEFIRRETSVEMSVQYPAYHVDGVAVWPLPAPWILADLTLSELLRRLNGHPKILSTPFLKGLKVTLLAYNQSIDSLWLMEIAAIQRLVPSLMQETWHYSNLLVLYQSQIEGKTVSKGVTVTWGI